MRFRLMECLAVELIECSVGFWSDWCLSVWNSLSIWVGLKAELILLVVFCFFLKMKHQIYNPPFFRRVDQIYVTWLSIAKDSVYEICIHHILIVTKVYTRVPRAIVYFSRFSVVFSIKKIFITFLASVFERDLCNFIFLFKF